MLSGLITPHSPVPLGESWLVCFAATHELVEIEVRSSQPVRSLELHGWARGLAVRGDDVFVGESANRASPGDGETASIARVSLSAWRVVDRVHLPCREIFDLVFAASPLLGAARRGFRTNPHRVAEADQLALFDQVGVRPKRLRTIADPLPTSAHAVDIAAELPACLQTDEEIEIPCSIFNRGSEILVSAPPHPVHVAYRWFDATSGDVVDEPDSARTRLPIARAPGEAVSSQIRVRAPQVDGTFLLRVTLVQEFVAWFDDTDASNACEASVVVERHAA